MGILVGHLIYQGLRHALRQHAYPVSPTPDSRLISMKHAQYFNANYISAYIPTSAIYEMH